MIKYLNCWIVILVLLFISAGCDNSVDPLDEEEGAYSIYGYLNLYKDVNYIRVKDLNKTFEESGTDEFAAEVILKNLNNGATENLEDTIVAFGDVKTHNFRTTMDLQPDTRYRVSVKGSDGKKTSATATTPPIAERNVVPFGANCTTRVDLIFDPVKSNNSLNLKVGFDYNSKTFWVRADKFLGDKNGKVIASFTPWTILEEVFQVFPSNNSLDEGEVFCDQLDSEVFKVRYTHFGPDLFTGKISDTLSIPGGAGRFGGLYRDSFSFRIDTTKLCPPYPLVECPGSRANQNL